MAGEKLTPVQRELLTDLAAAEKRGAFGAACDGSRRALAHALTRLGLADWRGESFGSSFWSITKAGRSALEDSSHE